MVSGFKEKEYENLCVLYRQQCNELDLKKSVLSVCCHGSYFSFRIQNIPRVMRNDHLVI